MCNTTENLPESFFLKNHIAITHLKQRLSEKKLVLCLGAGFSRPLKIPNWESLVKKIANDNRVKGTTVLENENLSLTTKIQVLYETFKKNYKKSKKNKEFRKDTKVYSLLYDDIIREEWMKIVWKSLYSEYHNQLKKKKKKKERPEDYHVYLKEYIKIIEKSPITVNYNFDDVIERMFDDERRENEVRKYESTSHPSMQFKNNKSVIYHPNGYIPYNEKNSIEGNFVFSEKSFQDQLIDTMSGRYNPLQYLFLNYTMLLTGLSLDDQTLRHMLRKNAILNPGHFHYFIYYIDPNKQEKIPSEEDMEAIRESYFETFNLVTLFLNQDEINQLATYINPENDETFNRKNLDYKLPSSYVFYISGTPGTGKTSSLNQLTDYIIQDEFQDRHRDDLYQSYKKLNDKQKKELNSWIQNQFRIRNMHIHRERGNNCIQLIDRSSIDPICFVDKNDKDAFPTRANELIQHYNNILEKGKVIVLEADSHELFCRLNKRNPNNENPKELNYPEKDIKETLKKFGDLFPNSEFKHIDTTQKSLSMVVKEIAHEIIFGKYDEVDLIECLNNYVKKIENKTPK